jgi:DNA-binding LytR/AlgR family response regulator
VRVLIADDEPVARDILREHVESTAGLKLVGEAATGGETVARILELTPDLVLLDLEMPERNGLAVVRSLRGAPGPLIIFVTAHDRHAVEAFEVGAVDYLLKPVRRERFEKAIEKARKQLRPASVPEGALRKIVGKRGSDMYLLDPS